jgi:exopolysaccharide production protein ExoZ
MKIWSLQVLRFWAALAVVVYHADTEIYHQTHRFGLLGLNGSLFGRWGVDVFFVLSGVIIALTSKGLTAQQFIGKRARRILPLYALFTAAYLAGGLFTGGFEWRKVVASLTLWPALDQMVWPVVPVAWTLCFEVLFYAATALVLWRPKLIWPLLAAFLAAMAFRAGTVMQFVGNPIILEFLLGVGLTRLPRWRGAVWLIPMGLAAAWFLGPLGYPANLEISDFLSGAMAWNRVLCLGVPAAMVVWGTMQIEGRKGVFSYLGDASYALYLVHLPFVLSIVWAACKFTSLPPDAIAILAVVASVLIGWRVHELFEKPILKWLGKPRPLARPALA